MTFIRDDSTGAIINKDDQYYKMILARREEKNKTQNLQEKIILIERELIEIKNLLNQVLNGKNYG